MRFRRAALSSVAFYADRAVRIVLAALRVPLYLRALGIEEYGVVLVLGGALGWLSLVDSGVNAGMTSHVARAAAAGDRRHLEAVISTSVATYGFLGLLVLLVATPLSLLPGLTQLLGIGSGYVSVVTLWLVLGVVGYGVALPLRSITMTLTGFQEGYVSTMLGTLQEVVLFLGLWFILKPLHSGLRSLAVWQGLFPLCWAVLCAWWAISWWRRELRPRFSRLQSALFRELLRLSGSFYWIQISLVVLWSVDNVVVSHSLGSQAVPAYSVSFQLFFIAMQVSTAFASSLWPAIAEAEGQGDWDWIRKAYSRVVSVSLGTAGLLAVLGVSFGRDVIVLWAGVQVFGGPTLLWVLAAWLVLQSWTSCHSLLLAGMGRHYNQMWVVPVEAAVNLIVSITLVGRIGIAGVAIGTLAGHAVLPWWYVPKDLKKQTSGMVSPSFYRLARVTAVGLGVILASYALGVVAGPPGTAVVLGGEVVAISLLFGAGYWGLCIPRAERKEMEEIARRQIQRWAGVS